MKVKCYALNRPVSDIATGKQGTLTHVQFCMDGSQMYFMQPHGLKPDTGDPVDGIWLVPTRIKSEEAKVERDIPSEIFGTIVEDVPTGFKGMAVALVYHISGCVHVDIQPDTTTKEGSCTKPHNFDLRRLKGDAVPKLTEEQREESQQKNPSPGETPARHMPSLAR